MTEARLAGESPFPTDDGVVPKRGERKRLGSPPPRGRGPLGRESAPGR
jgi:hypothetical protein